MKALDSVVFAYKGRIVLSLCVEDAETTGEENAKMVSARKKIVWRWSGKECLLIVLIPFSSYFDTGPSQS